MGLGESSIGVSSVAISPRTAIRRIASLACLGTAVSTAIGVEPRSRIYAVGAWLPVGLTFTIIAWYAASASRSFDSRLAMFWRSVAALGFTAALSAFGFVGFAWFRGSLVSLLERGQRPPVLWVAGVGLTGIATVVGVAVAAWARSSLHFQDRQRPRVAALDTVAIVGACWAGVAMFAIPPAADISLANLAVVLPLAAWITAATASFMYAFQRGRRDPRAASWLVVATALMATANALLASQLISALVSGRHKGTAPAAALMVLGAIGFGEALEMDARRSHRSAPLFAGSEANSTGSSSGTYRSDSATELAYRLVPVVVPPAVAALVVVVAVRLGELGPLQRASVVMGMAISFGGAVARGLLVRQQEQADKARLSTELLGERALVDEVLKAVDYDRAVVATRLHDHLVQPLTAAYLKLSHASVLLEKGDQPRASNLLEEGARAVSEQISEARSLVTTLYPPALEHLGIDAALKELVGAYRRRGVAVDAHWDWTGKLDRELAVAIYRIANEALENVALYSEPKKATIKLSAEKDALVLTVEDLGPGFDLQDELSYVSQGKIGLATMRRVAEMIGARLELSTIGKTSVRLTLPSCIKDRLGLTGRSDRS